jgi:DNA polymerase sigma
MLLKVQDNQTKFVIDITVHNMLPILNTKLIRMYSIYDQRFHILGLYLKHWSKINKIHGAADNYLSSYALLVMLIHFLQNVVEPKVLPNLQKVEEKEIIYEYNQNGETIKTNIYFEEDINKIKQNLFKLNQSRENIDSASSLLIKFFEYYSYNFDYYQQKISISKDKSECFKSKSDNIAFSIEDPFDNYHNPGKSMTINSNQFNKFITAMKKEINFILNGEYLKRLDKVTSINSSNQSALNMQLQMHMKNLHNLNNHQSNVNGTYMHTTHQ